MENVPDTGGALLVANHSGTIAVDARHAGHRHRRPPPQHRALRNLAADLVFETAVLGPFARKTGNTLACNPDAERLLSQANWCRCSRRGSKASASRSASATSCSGSAAVGSSSAAIRTGKPIIPVSIVGAEEIYPLLGNIKPLARALGLPYFPVTPTFPLLGPLGAIPLPSKWYIEFGEPIPTESYEPGAADDPMVIFELTDHVRETIQQSLYKLLMKRGSSVPRLNLRRVHHSSAGL